MEHLIFIYFELIIVSLKNGTSFESNSIDSS